MYPSSSKLKLLELVVFSLRYPQTLYIFVSIEDGKSLKSLKFESLNNHFVFQVHSELQFFHDLKT